ncbi:platelet endothelial aggregation receptor 1, partial [Biomphalaria glabrata]
SFMKTAHYSTPGTNKARTLNPDALDSLPYSNPITDGGTLWEIDLESSYIVQQFEIYFKPT